MQGNGSVSHKQAVNKATDEYQYVKILDLRNLQESLSFLDKIILNGKRRFRTRLE